MSKSGESIGTQVAFAASWRKPFPDTNRVFESSRYMITATISDLRLGIAAHRLDTMGNAFVLLAMTVVTLAFGLGLHLQLGVAVWLAVVAALSVLMALVMGHVSIERSETVAKLSQEIARLERELAGFKHQPADPSPPGYRSHAGASIALDKRPSVSDGVPPLREAFSAPSAAHGAPQAGQAEAGAALPMAVPPPLTLPQVGDQDIAAGARDPGPGPGCPPDPASARTIDCARISVVSGGCDTVRTPDIAAGFWPFRSLKTPRVDQYAGLAALDPMRPSAAADVASKNSERMRALSGAPSDAECRNSGLRVAGPSAPRPAVVSDAEVEQIHGVIKKLAEELRASKSGPAAPASSIIGVAQIAGSVQPMETQPSAEEGALLARAAQPVHPPREGTAAVTEAQSRPAPPSVASSAHARLGEIAGAIAAARLDVYLQPILGLSDLRARHYEVSVRLRGETGASIAPEEFTLVARDTGLLPLLDTIRVSRSAKVAGLLGDRGVAGSLFSQVSGESLASTRFMREFSDTYHQSETLAERLVLSFAQSDVRRFAAPEWATLKELVDLGFRFALEDVSDLDMDFEALTAAGFAFAKFDARVFLEGLPAQGGLIPAADLCRYLAHLGLTLIVGRIDDEAQLAKVLGFGALFGQGTLFGAARAVKPEMLRRKQEVAA
jgi:cyclic-di-GMP phosphodiesterase, flagellum assembly factor TipF